MDISKNFFKTALQYNQLNQYIDKSNNNNSTLKTSNQVLAEEITDDTLTKQLTDELEETEIGTLEEETDGAKKNTALKQPEISQSVKDMIESMAREKAKLFNTGCSERCGEPKTLLTVLERIEKDKDYTLDQYLEDVKELNIKGKAKKDLDTLYHMRRVEEDKYDECECEERKRRAKLLGYELKEQYGCCDVKKDNKNEKAVDIAL